MPTQRFLKLKEEKKQAILEAAVHEFSRVPYSSATINQTYPEGVFIHILKIRTT